MQIFLESIDIDLWDIVKSIYTRPTKMNSNREVIPTSISECDGKQKKKRYSYDAKAINAFLCS